jgi:hypothetical protein
VAGRRLSVLADGGRLHPAQGRIMAKSDRPRKQSDPPTTTGQLVWPPPVAVTRLRTAGYLAPVISDPVIGMVAHGLGNSHVAEPPTVRTFRPDGAWVEDQQDKIANLEQRLAAAKPRGSSSSLLAVLQGYRDKGDITHRQFELLECLLDPVTGDPLPPQKTAEIVKKLTGKNDYKGQKAVAALRRRTRQALLKLGGVAYFHIPKNKHIQLMDGRSTAKKATRS